MFGALISGILVWAAAPQAVHAKPPPRWVEGPNGPTENPARKRWHIRNSIIASGAATGGGVVVAVVPWIVNYSMRDDCPSGSCDGNVGVFTASIAGATIAVGGVIAMIAGGIALTVHDRRQEQSAQPRLTLRGGGVGLVL